MSVQHDPVQRADFDQYLVPNYAPAAFVPVRGLGLLLGCVLNDAWKGKAKAVLDAAAAEGVLVLQASPDVVRFAPSLVVEEADIVDGLDRFERAVAKLAQG
jgi:acetylornithine/N-succinyldiaminopimelate aminotransferase